ncbi:CaiB/BaiF CoA-transferase family protein [Stappia sp. ES.058]|uniref:CaiB/BaiF CoA transferase family protein n=1 Tax=Stappia sp. ES.058 TaxID=1881061 RepID=UPI00087A5C21|nr:CoA transferase [Stappia sp. ES.058]SDU44788.1 Crotonobetainyl-CoA:carnitine CoA-transferase CaiB [Stappia sp. ES.058]
MAGSLQGIRVLDLTNVLSGPFCCHQLAHFGAEVIKIERPGKGDLARQLGADPALNAANMGVSFLAQNAGKKSVTLNLKSEAGVALFKKLVATADVVVENFRPGVMDRLGVGFETLKSLNPRLVYCAISGFGQDGPMHEMPAYDQIVQGLSGVMSVTGDKDSAPLRVGYPVADTIGGLTAAFAISASLAGPREVPVFLDVSMLEATLATMGWVVSNWLIAGQAPAAHGNENTTSAPSGAFEARDGALNIAANKDEQWETLCAVLGRPDLFADTDYATRELRKANRFALKAELEKSLSVRDAADWVALFSAKGIPSGEILSVPDALDHPQVSDRGMIADHDDVPGVGRAIKTVRTGIKVNGAAPSVDTPPPVLGRDNDDIYGALGLDAEDLRSLEQEGAI